jgi:hypothetical protein
MRSRQPAPRPDCTARPGEAIRVFREDDGSFAIGVGRVAIASQDMEFVADVAADLFRLANTPAGEAALQQGDALGKPVRIEQPDPPTEPANGWAVPDDLAAAAKAGLQLPRVEGAPAARAGTGTGCGTTIVYDPVDWPRPGDPRSPSSTEVLLVLLRQANLNAQGGSDPGKPDWGVPAEEAP